MGSSKLSFPEIDIVKKELEAAKKKAQEISIDAFKKFFAGVFKKYPELFAIRWQGYTQYFNDGDTCSWHLHGPYFAFSTPVEVKAHSYDFQRHKSTFKTKLIRSVTTTQDLDNLNDEDDNSVWIDEHGDHGGIATDEKWNKLLLDLQNILDNEEIMKAIFDDHVEVTVTRDSIEVEDYDHD
jgi:hypothetical protein